MKKIIYALVLVLIVSVSSIMQAMASGGNVEVLETVNSDGASGVVCTQNKKMCIVGAHTIRTTGSKPLYIRDGVVCTPDRKTCTNGFNVMRSGKPLY